MIDYSIHNIGLLGMQMKKKAKKIDPYLTLHTKWIETVNVTVSPQ